MSDNWPGEIWIDDIYWHTCVPREESARYILADQWIPVTERLPKKRTRAWTWDGHKARELVYLPWVSMWVDDAKRKYPDVTHWQPLPDPPEEE